jgi:hypothetical protein
MDKRAGSLTRDLYGAYLKQVDSDLREFQHLNFLLRSELPHPSYVRAKSL